MKLLYMAWLWWTTSLFSALAFPLALRDVVVGRAASQEPRRLLARDDHTIITSPESGRLIVVGETWSALTIYTVMSICCAIVLALVFGSRFKTLKNNVLRKLNFTSILVSLLFFLGLGFILSAAVVQSGQGLRTHTLCYSSVIICLVFYTCNKLTIYMFLLERARIVRSPFMPRQKDWLWISGMIIIVGGFGSIAIVGYLSPIVELSKLDGRCRIGLPAKVSFPLLFFDIGVNILLTGLFIWLLKPVLSYHGLLSTSGIFGTKVTSALQRRAQTQQEDEQNDSELGAMNRNIRVLLWKCLIGSTCVMLPTVGNMAQFYIMKGRELGWICLTICTLDVSWGVIVVNWLTIGSAEAEKNLTTLVWQRTVSTGEQTLAPNARSRVNWATVAFDNDPIVIQDPGNLLRPEPAVVNVEVEKKKWQPVGGRSLKLSGRHFEWS